MREPTYSNGHDGWERLLGFRPERGDRLAALFLAASFLAFFAPGIFGGRLFWFGDLALDDIPRKADLARSGLALLWNPWLGFGEPLAANPEWAAFYPLNFLFHLLPAAPAMTVFILLHLALGLGSAYILCRGLRSSPIAASAAALAFAYGGFFLSAANHSAVIAAAAWGPMLLWAAGRALATGKSAFALVAGLGLAMQALGGELTVAACSLLALLFFLPAADARLNPPRPLGRSLAAGAAIFGVIAGLGLLVSGLQWVLATEFSRTGTVDGGTIAPGTLLGLLQPNLIADPASYPFWTLGFKEKSLSFLLSIYPGAGVIAVAAAGLFSKRGRTWLYAAGAALFLLLALGPAFLAYRGLDALLPGSAPRIPALCLYGFSLFIALLAAEGVDRLLAILGQAPRPPRSRLWIFWTAALVMAVACLAVSAGAEPTLAPGRELYDLHLLLLGLARIRAFIAIIALIAVLGLGRALGKPSLGWAICGIIFLDLFLAHRHLNPTTAAEFFAQPPLPAGIAGSRALIPPPAELQDRALGAGRTPLDFYRQQRQWLQGLTALELPAGNVLGRELNADPGARAWERRLAEREPDRERLLRLAGVAAVLRPGAEPARLRDPLPRAFVVPDAAWVKDRAQALAAVSDPAFTGRERAVLERRAPAAPLPRMGNSFWPMRLLRDDPGRVEVLVEDKHPGYLVLLESYAPGWKVTIDGEPAELLRANGFYSTVEVGPDVARVEFVYRPWRLWAGLGASVAGLLLAAVWLSRGRPGFWWWPLWALILVLLPLEEGGTTYLPVTAFRIAVLALAAVWALTLDRRDPKFHRSRVDLYLFALWVIAAASAAGSDYFYISFYWYLNVTTLVALFFIAAQFAAGAEGSRRAAALFNLAAAGGAIQAGWAIFEARGGGRASGGYFNPAYLAGSLMMVSPYLLARAFEARRLAGPGRLVRVVLWLSLFLLFGAGIIATQSRAIVVWPAALMLVAGPELAFIFSARGLSPARVFRATAAILVTALALLAVGLALVPNPLRERLRHLQSDEYAFERVHIWAAGLKMIADHPLGVGPGMFKYYSSLYRFPVDRVQAGRYEKRAENPHNEYLALAAEMSPAALLAAAIPAFGLILAGARRGARRRNAVALAAAGGLLAAALHALFDANLHDLSLAALAAAMAGVLAAELGREEGKWARVYWLRPGMARFLRGLLVAVLIGGSAGNALLAWSYGLSLRAGQEPDPERAASMLADAARYSFGNSTPFKLLAKLYLSVHADSPNVTLLERAEKEALRAQKLNPADPDPYALIGEANLELYRLYQNPQTLALAEKMFAENLRRDPCNVETCRSMARLSRLKGDLPAETRWWRRDLQLEPDDLYARAGLVRTLLRAGNAREARAEWRELVARWKETQAIQKQSALSFRSAYQKRMIKLDPKELLELKRAIEGLEQGQGGPSPPAAP